MAVAAAVGQPQIWNLSSDGSVVERTIFVTRGLLLLMDSRSKPITDAKTESIFKQFESPVKLRHDDINNQHYLQLSNRAKKATGASFRVRTFAGGACPIEHDIHRTTAPYGAEKCAISRYGGSGI